MIIYSVTINLDQEIEKDWVQYMRNRHIPDVLATGFFSEFNMLRLLDPPADEGTVTYNIQYLCESAEKLSDYRENHAPALMQEHTERYKDRFIAFRTVLEKL